jgi:hypothetical protein
MRPNCSPLTRFILLPPPSRDGEVDRARRRPTFVGSRRGGVSRQANLGACIRRAARGLGSAPMGPVRSPRASDCALRPRESGSNRARYASARCRRQATRTQTPGVLRAAAAITKGPETSAGCLPRLHPSGARDPSVARPAALRSRRRRRSGPARLPSTRPPARIPLGTARRAAPRPPGAGRESQREVWAGCCFDCSGRLRSAALAARGCSGVIRPLGPRRVSKFRATVRRIDTVIKEG